MLNRFQIEKNHSNVVHLHASADTNCRTIKLHFFGTMLFKKSYNLKKKRLFFLCVPFIDKKKRGKEKNGKKTLTNGLYPYCKLSDLQC